MIWQHESHPFQWLFLKDPSDLLKYRKNKLGYDGIPVSYVDLGFSSDKGSNFNASGINFLRACNTGG